MAASFRVVALLAGYNEEDIIAEVVADLIAQDVSVYYIDNHSTDGTLAQVERFVDRGVIGIETFPAQSPTHFEWGALLQRKEQLARQLPANWFIHTDADEFRESAWADVNLSQALARVDEAGYNSVDFALFNFWPTRLDGPLTEGVRSALRYCERGASNWADRQIKAWKNLGTPVDLYSSGGHDAEFEGRRVFPLRFPLRHYPIRSNEHGRRKLFHERKPRYLTAERQRPWHVQYDEFTEGCDFLRDPGTLREYRVWEVRSELAIYNRLVELRDQELVDVAQLATQKASVAHEEERVTYQREAAERERHLASELERISRELWAASSTLEELRKVRFEEHARHREEVESLERHHDTRSRELAAAHQAALTELREERQRLSAEQSAVQQRALHEKEAAHQRLLDDERAALERSLNEREAGHERALSERAASYERALSDERTAHEHALSALQNAHDESRAAAQQLMALALEHQQKDLRRTHERFVADLLEAQERAHQQMVGEERRRSLIELAARDETRDLELAKQREIFAEQLAVRAGDIERFREALDGRTRDLQHAERELTRLARAVVAAQEEIARLTADLNQVYTSRSWRVSSLGRSAWKMLGGG